jgi:octaprenyl-diphosphate synthase
MIRPSEETGVRPVFSAPALELGEIAAPVREDLERVEERIGFWLSVDVTLIDHVAGHILGARGKRMRPLVLLLAARAAAAGAETREPELLAAVVEFIHTATLLHDDVIDEAEERRGRRAAHRLWGNEAAILVGDFLYSRAFQMMTAYGEPRVMQILSETTNAIAVGEILQLLHCRNPAVDERAYFEAIERKTAVLFAASARLGALAAGRPDLEDPLMRYGLHLGRTFQLVDDVLDYRLDSGRLGKTAGADLAEGKPTLPLIYALARITGEERARLVETLLSADGSRLPEVATLLERVHAFEDTLRLARNERDRALDCLGALPPSEERTALDRLARFACARDY